MFEYKVTHLFTQANGDIEELEKELTDTYGKEGWELVHVHYSKYNGTLVAYFKRKKVEPSPIPKLQYFGATYRG